MKLFKVQVQYETVIRAKDSKSAEREANYIIRNECDSEPTEIDADEINSVSDLPYGWNVDCLPWGEHDGDKTIGELLNKE